MKKILLVLVMMLGLASFLMAQPTPGSDTYDAERLSTAASAGVDLDPTSQISQYVYIHVTMAGVIFSITDAEWIIGVPSTWYAFPSNSYHNAGTKNGSHPPYFNTHPSVPTPYGDAFVHDIPVIWNKGGVALDFLLSMKATGGWLYESRHSSNVILESNLNTQHAFENALQLRAIFLRGSITTGTGGDIEHYNDANGPANFKFNNDGSGHSIDMAAYFVSGNTGTVGIEAGPAIGAGLSGNTVVYTDHLSSAHPVGTGTAGGGLDYWSSVGASAGSASWFEASANRFAPPASYSSSSDIMYSATNKGVGLVPDNTCKLALQLMTPHTVTHSHAGLLNTSTLVKLQVWACPSDAQE